MDAIIQAKSGMGKTAVFVLATLHQLEPQPGVVSVLVLCHARELAYQIHGEYKRFAKYMKDVKVEVFFGGFFFSFPLSFDCLSCVFGYGVKTAATTTTDLPPPRLQADCPSPRTSPS